MVPGSYLPTRCEDPWGARSISFRDGCGPDLDLIVEVHRKLTPMNSIVLAEALAPFNLYFPEDPIQIDSIVSQAGIARRIHVPLGNGKRLTTIWEFRELLAAGGPQYVRPDIALAGGLIPCITLPRRDSRRQPAALIASRL